MFKLTIWYSDGFVGVKEFASWKEADWYAHNEGDHVLTYKIEEIK